MLMWAVLVLLRAWATWGRQRKMLTLLGSLFLVYASVSIAMLTYGVIDSGGMYAPMTFLFSAERGCSRCLSAGIHHAKLHQHAAWCVTSVVVLVSSPDVYVDHAVSEPSMLQPFKGSMRAS